MDKITLVANRKNIELNGKTILKNYWYKYVIYIIQSVINKEEMMMAEVLGDTIFESFYDRADEYSSHACSTDIDELDIPEEVVRIGLSIEEYFSNDKELVWMVNDRRYKVTSDITDLSKLFFSNSIIPFLEINDASIVIKTVSPGLNELFQMQLVNAGLIEERVTSSATFVEKIIILNDDTESVKWDEKRDKFSICKDLCECVELSIQITETGGRIKDKLVPICFPFFERGDLFEASIWQNDDKWLIYADNEKKHIKYVGEIEL